MQHGAGVGQHLHQLARAARVIEVRVRDEKIFDLFASDAEFIERTEQTGYAGRTAGVDERGVAIFHDEVAGGEPRPRVQGVYEVDTAADGFSTGT